MSELRDPLLQICTYGKERLLRFRLPHRTYPWGGALSRFSAVLRKSINRVGRQGQRGRISGGFDRDSISEHQSHRDQARRWGRRRLDQGCCRSRRYIKLKEFGRLNTMVYLSLSHLSTRVTPLRSRLITKITIRVSTSDNPCSLALFSLTMPGSCTPQTTTR